MLSLPFKKEQKNVKNQRGVPVLEKFRFLREKFRLLSKIVGDPIVGDLRDKKENCSMRRGLRVGNGFREFPQTPRGRGFSLLGFYSFFKYFPNV